MSAELKEVKKEARTLNQVGSEYQNLCVKAGNTQYQIVTLQKDLDIMNQALRDLNNEAFQLQQDEKAANAAALAAEESTQSAGV